GATIGYVACGRRLGRHAALLGALAGITPDIDHFVSSETDPLLYVEYHRHFTHSLLFAFVGAFLPMLPWLLRKSFRAQWKTLWLCSWPAYLSHCLLDASTTWGTQLYWPFANTRVSWDIIAIVDPIFTLTILFLLLWTMLRRSGRAANIALIFAVAYLGFGAAQHMRAKGVQRKLATARGHSMLRSEVMPTLANNVVWRSVYLADGRIYSDRIRVSWFAPGTARPGLSLPLLTASELTVAEQKANRVHRGFDRFAWFSDGWIARAPGDEEVIGDMRYSRSTDAFDPVWGIRFITRDGEPAVEWVSRERGRKLGLSQLWDEISGRDQRFKPLAAR
ncbi:MAG TPA: metal-dependent hydrolase, partial [Terriglobales bacterium]|nr:metal-dependent hydrolase [Terriglobales bacterium]